MKKSLTAVVSMLCIIALAFLLIPFLYFFVLEPFEIRGSSMNPTYKEGQLYFTDKLFYKLGGLKKGDTIVFKSPENNKEVFIARIIGIPGDQLKLEYGKVYVNGVEFDEKKYIAKEFTTTEGTFAPNGRAITVSPASYFVMGDNRQFSTDSRDWGLVPEKDILGKMTFCYWGCK